MKAPMIAKSDVDGIIAAYRRRWSRARWSLERAALWKRVIHEFRVCSVFWHVEPEELTARRCYYLIEKSFLEETWHELARGRVVQVRNGTAVVRGKEREHTVKLERIVAFENGRIR